VAKLALEVAAARHSPITLSIIREAAKKRFLD
jgi:hypothetical protein